MRRRARPCLDQACVEGRAHAATCAVAAQAAAWERRGREKAAKPSWLATARRGLGRCRSALHAEGLARPCGHQYGHGRQVPLGRRTARGFLFPTNVWRQKTHFSHFWGGGGAGPSKVRRLIADRSRNRRIVQIRLGCQIGLHANTPEDLVAIQRRQLDTHLEVVLKHLLHTAF